MLSVRVLVVGATGFMGSRLASALARAGHEVLCASRQAGQLPFGCAQQQRLDYTAMPGAGELQRMLTGCDVVINAVGILRNRGSQTLAVLHTRGPQALFSACVAAGVRRVLQISAAGAEATAVAEYHRSKYAADRHLMALPIDWVVLKPSLVYGAGGASARLFDTLASLPLVQPVHIDDLVAAVVKACESPAALHRVLPVVGPEPVSLRQFILGLRAGFGIKRATVIPVPRSLMRLAAWLGDFLPGSMLGTETLQMLERGNTGDPAPLTRWLGHAPRPVSAFIAPLERAARLAAASLQWLLPLLRVCVAGMWFIAAIVSAGPHPVANSVTLLETIGVPAPFAAPVLWSAVALNLLFGIITLWPRRPRWLWTAQIMVVLTYTLIISWRLPELWLEPFGPVAKNLPILALLLLLQRLDRRA
jgi:uncharacterized protein YbjT (DUF2867 family)